MSMNIEKLNQKSIKANSLFSCPDDETVDSFYLCLELRKRPIGLIVYFDDRFIYDIVLKYEDFIIEATIELEKHPGIQSREFPFAYDEVKQIVVEIASYKDSDYMLLNLRISTTKEEFELRKSTYEARIVDTLFYELPEKHGLFALDVTYHESLDAISGLTLYSVEKENESELRILNIDDEEFLFYSFQPVDGKALHRHIHSFQISVPKWTNYMIGYLNTDHLKSSLCEVTARVKDENGNIIQNCNEKSCCIYASEKECYVLIETPSYREITVEVDVNPLEEMEDYLNDNEEFQDFSFEAFLFLKDDIYGYFDRFSNFLSYCLGTQNINGWFNNLSNCFISRGTQAARLEEENCMTINSEVLLPLNRLSMALLTRSPGQVSTMRTIGGSQITLDDAYNISAIVTDALGKIVRACNEKGGKVDLNDTVCQAIKDILKNAVYKEGTQEIPIMIKSSSNTKFYYEKRYELEKRFYEFVLGTCISFTMDEIERFTGVGLQLNKNVKIKFGDTNGKNGETAPDGSEVILNEIFIKHIINNWNKYLYFDDIYSNVEGNNMFITVVHELAHMFDFSYLKIGNSPEAKEGFATMISGRNYCYCSNDSEVAAKVESKMNDIYAMGSWVSAYIWRNYPVPETYQQHANKYDDNKQALKDKLNSILTATVGEKNKMLLDFFKQYCSIDLKKERFYIEGYSQAQNPFNVDDWTNKNRERLDAEEKRIKFQYAPKIIIDSGTSSIKKNNASLDISWEFRAKAGITPLKLSIIGKKDIIFMLDSFKAPLLSDSGAEYYLNIKRQLMKWVEFKNLLEFSKKTIQARPNPTKGHRYKHVTK